MTTNEPDIDTDCEPVSSASVLTELVAVRAREGLLATKLRDGAPNILRLRATTMEWRRRTLAADDRHVAAFEMIKCAVVTLVPRTDYSLILRRTLNLVDADATSLDNRRTNLKAALFMTDKEFRSLETHAYEYFAAALVAAFASPCKSDLDPKGARAELSMTVSASPEVLASLLNSLTLETRSTVRFITLESMLLALPNVWASIGELMLLSPRAGFDRFTTSLIERVWSSNPPRHLTPVFSARSMSLLLTRQGGDLEPTAQLVLDLEANQGREMVQVETGLEATGLSIVPAEYFTRLRASFLHLAALILELEERNLWREVLWGQTDFVTPLRVARRPRRRRGANGGSSA